METLQLWLEGSQWPVLTAFLLGLLTAVSPCPLAANITAIGFLGKHIGNNHRTFLYGMLYTLGRTLTYTALGSLLIAMLRQGIDTFDLQAAVTQWGERLAPPALLATGLLLLFGHRLPLRGFGTAVPARTEALRGAWASLLLGLLLAIAFCPTSGLLYFGILIPLAASATGGYLLPAVYAIGTGLPVVAVAWTLAFSVGNIANFYRRMQAFQRWIHRAAAVLFIITGLYYAYLLYL